MIKHFCALWIYPFAIAIAEGQFPCSLVAFNRLVISNIKKHYYIMFDIEYKNYDKLITSIENQQKLNYHLWLSLKLILNLQV